MNLARDLLGTTKSLLTRAGTEVHFAGTLLQAAGPGVALVPPHRYLAVLRAFESYGPAGAGLALGAAMYGHHHALVDERGPVTFVELDRRSSALANALVARGFRSGDAIGILARNHRGIFEAIFAGAKLGARTVLLNTDFSGPQLADVCRREDVAVLIHDDEFGDIVAGYDAPLGHVSSWSDGGADGGRTAPTIDELIDSAPTRTPHRPRHKQRIVLLTSGTTGTPKGAPRDLAVSLAAPGSYLSRIPLRAGRTVFVAAPVFHAWGMGSAMIALGLGNTLVLSRRFDPHFTVAALEHHRCDALITVPILLSRLLDVGEEFLRTHDLTSLRIVALSGSALSPEVATRAMDALGDVVYNLYGSTEVAYASVATPADLREAPGTVGRPPFGTVVKLLDAGGHEVALGETGRIFVGNTIQFAGYTGGGGKEMVDGLMATGDVGHWDDDGRLFVDGRDDDMIVSGGENVFPVEIEDLLTAQPQIREAVVVGVPDEEFGQRLRAYVVLVEGATLDEAAVRDLVRANLARYKVPRDVVFLDGLPRNPAGKVVKRDLPA